jgi:predicted ATP-dependent endonuclease of OLD family
MKLKTLKLKNFRSYKEEVSIDFDDLTTFVGKNDCGKSTILEALDIFFNNGTGTVKLDKDDINKHAVAENDYEICISACFEDLPAKVILDATNETSLKKEFLLNKNNQLEIIKKYPNAGKEKVFIRAIHPCNKECCDLLQKKDSELKKIVEKYNLECDDSRKNAFLREAIWNHFKDNLDLKDIEIDVTKGDTKSIWDNLQTYLPIYSLFQSDRKNSDGDSEVQDPLKEAVKQILSNDSIKSKLKEVSEEVTEVLKDVSVRTLEKLKEMNPTLANTLIPIIPDSESLKWADVFKSVSIASDEGIPVNKRGSGVKRLILLNFFRAEAEKRLSDTNAKSIIYAIEEPETSQHFQHQKLLIKALKELSQKNNTQVIITTHSATIVKELNFDNLRLVSNINGIKSVSKILENNLPYPSLNEVNYIAFDEITEEYHNELYGFIELENQLNNYKAGKTEIPYIRLKKDGSEQHESKILSEYIRHQIHHPENTSNPKYTFEQLKESIETMRNFIQTLP